MWFTKRAGTKLVLGHWILVTHDNHKVYISLDLKQHDGDKVAFENFEQTDKRLLDLEDDVEQMQSKEQTLRKK